MQQTFATISANAKCHYQKCKNNFKERLNGVKKKKEKKRNSTLAAYLHSQLSVSIVSLRR